jgi:hypothetical protein
MRISLCRPSGGVTDNGLRCEAVEPRQSYPGDGDQRWYDGEEWERGRHGAPTAPGESGAAHTGENTAYGGADSYSGDGYERRFNSPRFSDPLTDSAAGAIPAATTDPAEPSRRPVEAIDVAALRRPPPDDPPAVYGSPPAEFPPVNYAASGPYNPPSEQPAYPAGSTYGPGSNPLSAPTAAVNTIQPGGSSVYHSRKPAIAIVLAVLTVIFEIPALRLLGSAVIEDVVPTSGIVSGTFLVLGLPVFAYGVYNLLNGTGATSLAGWLRVPLVYLPLGVLLFLLAALAA